MGELVYRMIAQDLLRGSRTASSRRATAYGTRTAEPAQCLKEHGPRDDPDIHRACLSDTTLTKQLD